MDYKTIYTNTKIAELLKNLATASEIKNRNQFRVISYENAADSVSTFPESLYEIWQKNPANLDNVPGIGEGILKKLNYLFRYHKYGPTTQKILQNIHPAVFTFTKVSNIGPKTAYKLTKNLKFPADPIKSLEKLIFYAQKGKIRNIPTLGEKSEEQILENTLAYLGRKNRMEYSKAFEISQKIINYLKQKFPKAEFVPLGSLRRQSQTVGDIDIAIKSNQHQEIIDYFLKYPENIQTILDGPKKASMKIKNDVRVDIMIQPASTFGSLIQHFTGSKQHNILLRRYSQKIGYSLSEYGIKDLKSGKIYTFENEKDFYNFLHLCYIEPTQRLGKDEIEKAQKCYTNKVKN